MGHRVRVRVRVRVIVLGLAVCEDSLEVSIRAQ